MHYMIKCIIYPVDQCVVLLRAYNIKRERYFTIYTGGQGDANIKEENSS